MTSQRRSRGSRALGQPAQRTHGQQRDGRPLNNGDHNRIQLVGLGELALGESRGLVGAELEAAGLAGIVITLSCLVAVVMVVLDVSHCRVEQTCVGELGN